MRNDARRPLRLRVGDVVEVRNEDEILATLDESGALDSLPFMPEMLEYCGRQFRVVKRSDKTCDTINYSGSRRMFDTVHLEGLRCNGGAHGGCQARCMLFWKEGWLRRIEGSGDATPRVVKAAAGRGSAVERARCDRPAVSKGTRQPGDNDAGETLYRCQATELLRASTPLPWWDVRQYVRDVRSGNVGIMDVVRAGLFRMFDRLLKLGGYRALLWSYNRMQTWRGGTPYPHVAGSLDKTPRETLDLQPGELVEVKGQQEILKTVNRRNRNLGLSFDPEMVRYCGSVRRVVARVDQIIDERTGKMIKLSRDCIILDGVYCRAEYSHRRLFCPRSLYPFWREIWLKRAEGSAAGSAPPERRASDARE